MQGKSSTKMPKMKKQNKKAFTLLELIVVVVILGALAAIAVPSFLKVDHKSKVANIETTLKAVERDARALAKVDQVPLDKSMLETASTEAKGGVYKVASDASSISLEKYNLCRELVLGEGTFNDCTPSGATSNNGASSIQSSYTPERLNLNNTATPLVTNGIFTPYAATISDGYLYFTERNNERLSRVPLSGGAVETIAQMPYLTGLTKMGNYLYVVEQTYGKLYRLPITGGVLQEVIIPNPVRSLGVSTDGTALYITRDAAKRVDRVVVDSFGSAQLTTIATNIPFAHSSLADGKGNLYVSSGSGQIYKLALHGDTPADASLLQKLPGAAYQMVLAKDQLYVANGGDGKIIKLDLTNPDAATNKTVIASQGGLYVGLVTDGKKLYYTQFSYNRVGVIE